MMEIQRGNLRAVSLTLTRILHFDSFVEFSSTHTFIHFVSYYVIKGIFLSTAL